MRHKKNKLTLDRKSAARRSLMANLAESLILYEKIKTTKAKGRAVKALVERLIAKAKKQTLASRREIAKTIYTQNVVRKLMQDLAVRYKERKGGCTRLILLKNRVGDGAEEAVVELL